MGCKNRMAISHADLKRENCSITNNIQIFLILVSVFLSLKYKFYDTARQFPPIYFCFNKYPRSFILMATF